MSDNKLINAKYFTTIGLHTETVNVRSFMLDSVKRMLAICERLGEHNFINDTANGNYYAFVTADQTIGLNLEKYNDTLKINIGQKFVCAKLFGADSQVSTLCHELSHFNRFGNNGEFGCMGTKDMGKANYKSYADSLINKHSVDVFYNSYNVERYFEIN